MCGVEFGGMEFIGCESIRWGEFGGGFETFCVCNWSVSGWVTWLFIVLARLGDGGPVLECTLWLPLKP